MKDKLPLLKGTKIIWVLLQPIKPNCLCLEDTIVSRMFEVWSCSRIIQHQNTSEKLSRSTLFFNLHIIGSKLIWSEMSSEYCRETQQGASDNLDTTFSLETWCCKGQHWVVWSKSWVKLNTSRILFNDVKDPRKWFWSGLLPSLACALNMHMVSILEYLRCPTLIFTRCFCDRKILQNCKKQVGKVRGFNPPTLQIRVQPLTRVLCPH